jgi:hypothetical protein
MTTSVPHKRNRKSPSMAQTLMKGKIEVVDLSIDAKRPDDLGKLHRLHAKNAHNANIKPLPKKLKYLETKSPRLLFTPMTISPRRQDDGPGSGTSSREPPPTVRPTSGRDCLSIDSTPGKYQEQRAPLKRDRNSISVSEDDKDDEGLLDVAANKTRGVRLEPLPHMSSECIYSVSCLPMFTKPSEHRLA